MLDIALVNGFLGGAANIVEKLKSEKAISHEGLVIYQKSSEVEYRIDLSIGDQKSRITTFKNILRSHTLKKITLEASEATGTGMSNENLLEMELMRWDANKLTIDFPRIFSEVKSNLVIITFKARFSSELIDKLVHRQINKVSSMDDGKIIAHFELILDYANMWYSNFTSFTVRNIEFTINHQLPQNEINSLMTEGLRKKIGRADEVALKKENARKFLLEFQKIILEIQEPEFLLRLQELITVDPPTNGRIDTIIPSLRVYNLKHSNIGLTIPDLFILKVCANIEDRETAVHGTITFDLERFRDLLREKFKKFQNQNKKIKF